MSTNTWSNTAIFKKLEANKSDVASRIIVFLKQPSVMNKIESILRDGSTTPKDFTLHNADHSFRVAERMWELIPEKTKKILSEYELTFLLLSAYLHDIGMSPTYEKVINHETYLTTGNKQLLSEQEIADLQKWIDNEPKTSSIDVKKEKITDATLSDYVLSYYIRHKHNDWSGEWIKENIKDDQLPGLFDWVDDLIKVCKSHHYELEHLLGEAFDPKPAGTGKVLHLRYLSICLRVADILENDPERTPEVILQHRMIDKKSLTYWLKDRRFTLTRNSNRFSIYARPEKAYLHKAIEETADGIERELKLCEELQKTKPLNHSTFIKIEGYLWEIDSFVIKDIAPKEDTYVYIQGAFRPNTAKILELLGGNQLYGDPIWAVRELIQNAFDSVKERIAYQIINENRSSTEYLPRLGDLYSVDISMEERVDGIWLICSDQGVGMTKSIIEKFFLESGSSQRHEIKELERKCNERGFKLNRTGQFGIGVLSYFMLAEKIVVITRRESNTGYDPDDSVAWRFEINGTHDFGELKKTNKSNVGTIIEFKLKPNIENDIQNWYLAIAEFIGNNIIKVPCALSYKDEFNHQIKKIVYGWAKSKKEIRNKIINDFEKNYDYEIDQLNEYVTVKRKDAAAKYKSLIQEVIKEIEDKIDFLVDEGDFLGLAQYRIHIPYFKLCKGNSFLYLKERFESENHCIEMVKHGYYWSPEFDEINLSLKGIKIDPTENPLQRNFSYDLPTYAYIELDIELIDPSLVTVSRHGLNIEHLIKDFTTFINTKCVDLLHNNSHLFENQYGTLNCLKHDIFPIHSYWISEISFKDRKICTWSPIKLPITKIPHDVLCKDVKYRGQRVHNITDIEPYEEGDNYSLRFIIDGVHKMGIFQKEFFKDNKPLLAPIITEYKFSISDGESERYNSIELPQVFKNVLLFEPEEPNTYTFLEENYLNNQHELYKYFDPRIFTNIEALGKDISIDQLSDPQSCLSFVIYCIYDDDWDELYEVIGNKIQHCYNVLNITEINVLMSDYYITRYSLGKEDRFYAGSDQGYLDPELIDQEFQVLIDK
ncbi:Histidine kinase-, DNA gyrase B-, and HSP90-like ATPase [Chitinophaga sp. YR573]|uniref:HD domain-containing protein n=1 Tax=Chitinophaga sp. YR573 TaxID=1881040 RepID=UPI0008C07273|nr:ATP-binding protein [Chitinophaga sp. YR573]SEW35151.1 Histidine kinase-, DNA gyrase B-, and HSP90-like ATPase [Chitinophaga sp. YR573]